MIKSTEFIKLLDACRAEVELSGDLTWKWESNGDCHFEFTPVDQSEFNACTATLHEIFANHGIQVTDSFNFGITHEGLIDYASHQQIVVVDRRGASVEHYHQINGQLLDLIVNDDATQLFGAFRDPKIITFIGTGAHCSVNLVESFCSATNGNKQIDATVDLRGIVVIVATHPDKPIGWFCGLSSEQLDIVDFELRTKPGIPNRLRMMMA